MSNVCGRPSIATKSRRSSVISPTLCLAAEKKDKQEEEVLDEKAMRAAEIHEVLIGLQDFKERIVNDATQLAKKVRGMYIPSRHIRSTRCVRSSTNSISFAFTDG